MAFKPFHFFRKRMKLFMAALVFIAMITFVGVVGSGQGIGSGWARGLKGMFGIVDNAIGQVGGQGYDFALVQQLQRQRRAAAEFVMQVHLQGQEKMMENLGFTAEDRKTNERFQKKMEEINKKDPNALKALDAAPASLAYEAVQPFVRRLQIMRQYGIDPTLLGMPDPLQPEPLLEFAYWQKQADDLGIVASPDRVRQDLVRAGHSLVKEEELGAIVQVQKLAVDVDTLVKWVGEEIRVMLARAVILAPDRSSGSILSAQVTPLDLWQAYVKIKTQLTVGVLPVQVSSKEFLDRVPMPATTDTAKWQEFVTSKLKPFFEEYKRVQPDPTRETPGFMIPKKYQIEFLYGDVRASTDTRRYYEKLAVTHDALAPIAHALGTLGLPLPTTEAHRSIDVYKLNKLSGRYHLPDDLQSILIAGVELADGSRYQLPIPTTGGAFNTSAGVEQRSAGQQILDIASAAALSQFSPLALATAVRPIPRKVTRALPMAQSLELAAVVAAAGQDIGVALQPALLSYYARLPYAEETKPFHEVVDSIRDESIEEQCRILIQRDLQQLKKDLEEYGKKYRLEYDKWKRQKMTAEGKGLTPPKFEAPPYVRKEGEQEIKEPVFDYIKRFAAARGLTYEGMKEPRGPYDLFAEKDATPLGSILRPVYVKSLVPSSTRKPDDEIRTALIGGKGAFDPAQVQAPTVKPWEFAMHWKVVETDARVPSYAEAEPQVIEAWKIKEARVFALEQANAYAKQARTEDGEKSLRDNPAYMLENLLGRYTAAGPFSYRKSTITYIDNPPDDLIDQALEKLKAMGDTLVVANKSKSTYYLIVLKSREEPKATSKESLTRFDFDVLIPDRHLQIQVDNEGISNFVQREQAREFLKLWEKYFRSRTEFNEEEATKIAEALRSSSGRR